MSFIPACTSTLTLLTFSPSPFSLSHSLTLSPFHSPTFSLSHSLTTLSLFHALSHHPTLPPSHSFIPSPPHPLTLQPVSMVEDNGLVIVRCKRHLVTRLLIGDVLLLVAYLWGLYIFRFKSPKHLATLMETVIFVLTSRSQQSLLLLTCHLIYY